jgi:hypothetical protein
MLQATKANQFRHAGWQRVYAPKSCNCNAGKALKSKQSLHLAKPVHSSGKEKNSKTQA